MITIVTYLWGKKFNIDHVRKLDAGIKRNLKQPHKFVVVMDRNPVDIECEAWPIPHQDMMLIEQRGCFARLRVFDPFWQHQHHIDDRLVCIDLDTVITGPLDPLFDRPEPFVIMQGANASNPCPMNGALMMLRAGAHQEIWNDFSLEAAKKIPFYSFPDDQGWIWHKAPDAAGWRVGSETGVYVYNKRGWPSGDALPRNARLVTFINNDPGRLLQLPWVRDNWKL